MMVAGLTPSTPEGSQGATWKANATSTPCKAPAAQHHTMICMCDIGIMKYRHAAGSIQEYFISSTAVCFLQLFGCGVEYLTAA
jgi:hypothetical protein